jgi:phosphoribosyl-ATP pyrophosphohydrolase
VTLDPAALRYDADGLITCVCQDAATGDVLMVAWATREALERTLATGRATFWSRSRRELWEKGATSGNALDVVELAADCDGDTVLVQCRPRDADASESYTARILGGPREHVARKVGEEAVETLLAPAASDALVGEIADLWFHSMLLLAHDGVEPLAPLRELERRHAAP